MNNKNYNKTIYVFWHDWSEAPGYIKLLLEMWELGDWKLSKLDYSNAENFINEKHKKVFNLIKTSKALEKAQVSDILALLVLYENGGFFLDSDMIFRLSSNDFNRICNSIDEDVFYQSSAAFNLIKKRHSIFLHKVIDIIYKKVKFHHFIYFFTGFLERSNTLKLILKYIKFPHRAEWEGYNLHHLLKRKDKKLLKELGNFNDFFKDYIVYSSDFIKLPKAIFNSKYNKLREMICLKRDYLEYICFYFREDITEEELNRYLENTKNKIVYLNNDFTPNFIKNMSSEDILNSQMTIAKIYKKISAEKN